MNDVSPAPLADLAVFLTGFHALAGAANGGAALYGWKRKRLGLLITGAGAAAVFSVLAGLAMRGRPPVLPESLRNLIDAAMGPTTLMLGSCAALAALFFGRRFFVRGPVAWTILNLALVTLASSLPDPDFLATVSRPDNVPIVAMVFLVGFFLWLATSQAVRNDDRLARGLLPEEADPAPPVLVWPEIVYLELIGAIAATAVLVLWSLAISAPLEGPANPSVTPNPSKAPWYFVGLQEMLVYFAPSVAGAIVPALIVVGLMAIPYLDVNPKGNGYYTIRERPLACLVFLFGFLQLWIFLILVGTFLRGPNWSFFGPYETPDPHRMAAVTNATLAERAWTGLLGRAMPAGSGFAGILAREAPGLIVLAAYFLGLPLLLARTAMRSIRRQMGRWRYAVALFLVLMMFALPIKMVLQGTFHLSYLVNIPEISLYF